jgi:hypothetical protein
MGIGRAQHDPRPIGGDNRKSGTLPDARCLGEERPEPRARSHPQPAERRTPQSTIRWPASHKSRWWRASTRRCRTLVRRSGASSRRPSWPTRRGTRWQAEVLSQRSVLSAEPPTAMQRAFQDRRHENWVRVDAGSSSQMPMDQRTPKTSAQSAGIRPHRRRRTQRSLRRGHPGPSRARFGTNGRNARGPRQLSAPAQYEPSGGSARDRTGPSAVCAGMIELESFRHGRC